MKRLAIWLLLALLPISASAQNVADPSGQQVVGAAQYRATLNNSVAIATGNTFQLILAGAGPGTSNVRQSLTIENNNNSTDACYLIVGQASQVTSGSTTTSSTLTIAGASITAAQASIYLAGKGGSYTRYWPYVPNDPIYATCASSGDSLYVDIQ